RAEELDHGLEICESCSSHYPRKPRLICKAMEVISRSDDRHHLQGVFPYGLGFTTQRATGPAPASFRSVTQRRVRTAN
ncbi:Hypothetical predicted protein, partial [Marmota monax]